MRRATHCFDAPGLTFFDRQHLRVFGGHGREEAALRSGRSRVRDRRREAIGRGCGRREDEQCDELHRAAAIACRRCTISLADLLSVAEAKLHS